MQSDSLEALLILIAATSLAFSTLKEWIFLKNNKSMPFYFFWRSRNLLLSLYLILNLCLSYFFFAKTFADNTLTFILISFIFFGNILLLLETIINNKTYQNIDKSNNALASANVNMAILYAQLDELKENIERQRNELDSSNKELKATQSQMIQMEKMAALGQLIAGIAHEINTPMGAIQASGSNISDLVENQMKHMIEILREVSSDQYILLNDLIATSLSNKSFATSEEDRTAKRKLRTLLEKNDVHDSDGIADILIDMHIYVGWEKFMPLLKSESGLSVLNAASIIANINESSKTIQLSTQKVKKIIFALKNFAHFDTDTSPKPFDLKQNIENVLTLYENQIKCGVELSFHIDPLIPQLIGFPDELGQVWTNLIHNSLQAMDFKGDISVDVIQDADHIYVSITDSGKGIPSNIQSRIFEPFFTTKGAGEGSGLGLHVVRKIVEKHEGKISFESTPGRTTFMVTLQKKI